MFIYVSTNLPSECAEAQVTYAHTHITQIKGERPCREPCYVVLTDTDKNGTASSDPFCVFTVIVFEAHI